MTICAYALCPIKDEEVNESEWHIEVIGLGVMHLDCHKLYLIGSSCAWCKRSMNPVSRNVVAHLDRLYHIVPCFEQREKSESQQEYPHMQLTLNFEEV